MMIVEVFAFAGSKIAKIISEIDLFFTVFHHTFLLEYLQIFYLHHLIWYYLLTYSNQFIINIIFFHFIPKSLFSLLFLSLTLMFVPFYIVDHVVNNCSANCVFIYHCVAKEIKICYSIDFSLDFV